MILREVASKQLNRLSAQIGSKWCRAGTLAMSGRAPDSKTLTEIDKLTTRYRKAHKAHDAGDYLECIKVATDEVEEVAA